MNFNPMELINIKEHFSGCFDSKEVSKFINILLDLQAEGVQDEQLKEKLPNFEAKQEMIQLAYQINKLKVMNSASSLFVLSRKEEVVIK